MSNQFKLVRPFQVSDVSLVSSTVSATDPSASGSYSAGTTYGLGTIVQVDSPTFTFTASGAILTATGHGWADNDILRVSSSGTLPAGLTAGVLYYVVQANTDTLKLSLTKDGAPITTTSAGTGTHTATVSSHKVYESLSVNNIGNTPHKSPTHWLDMGMTNRWKPFDTSVTSQAERFDSMTYVFQTKGRINNIVLLNLSAYEVVITARESGGGAIVYGPTTYSLRSALSTTSFWSWFFEPMGYKQEFVGIDFPPYVDLEITVTINDTGKTVKCGAIILGLSKTLGTTLSGATAGITDYSVKSQDEFGNYTVLERAFRKRGSFEIMVDRVASDGIQQTLEKYRATPVVYIGSSEYGSTIIYGFYRDFSVNIAYHTYSICSIDIEGLT